MIQHPTTTMSGATTFFIQGTIDAVLNARRYLIVSVSCFRIGISVSVFQKGCLPIQLMFDVSEATSRTVDLKELEKQTNLAITLRPKKADEFKVKSKLNRSLVFAVIPDHFINRNVS